MLDPYGGSLQSKWTALGVEMRKDNAFNGYLQVICQVVAVTKVNRCSPVIQSLKEGGCLYQLNF